LFFRTQRVTATKVVEGPSEEPCLYWFIWPDIGEPDSAVPDGDRSIEVFLRSLPDVQQQNLFGSSLISGLKLGFLVCFVTLFGSSYSEIFRVVVEVRTKLNCEQRPELEEFAASGQGNPVYTRERLAKVGSWTQARPGP
jgi:hypothetical protein